MVSFQCQACQDVVKKPKLDQHRGRCGAGFDCIDCSKSFSSPAEYKGHTSCISEAEKYQKGLYKGPKTNGQGPRANGGNRWNSYQSQGGGYNSGGRSGYGRGRPPGTGANDTPLGTPNRISPMSSTPGAASPAPAAPTVSNGKQNALNGSNTEKSGKKDRKGETKVAEKLGVTDDVPPTDDVKDKAKRKAEKEARKAAKRASKVAESVTEINQGVEDMVVDKAGDSSVTDTKKRKRDITSGEGEKQVDEEAEAKRRRKEEKKKRKEAKGSETSAVDDEAQTKKSKKSKDAEGSTITTEPSITSNGNVEETSKKHKKLKSKSGASEPSEEAIEEEKKSKKAKKDKSKKKDRDQVNETLVAAA